MGRLKNELKQLPTAKMRSKAFARIVRMALCHKEDIKKPYANLMDTLIKSAMKSLIGPTSSPSVSLTAQKFLVDMGETDGSFVSSGRWKDWWDGAKPSPKKLDILDFLLPQTKLWFEPNKTVFSSQSSFDYRDTLRSKKSEKALHPIYTFLKAVDIWASKKDATLEALELLLQIQNTWRPRQYIDFKNNNIVKGDWYVEPRRDISIPSTMAIDNYRSLEPSSIMQFMLFSGDFLNITDTSLHSKWTFDLMSAALATKTIIYSKDIESVEAGLTTSDLGGISLDIMGVLIAAFITKQEAYSMETKGTNPMSSVIKSLNRKPGTPTLPTTHSFELLISKSRTLFFEELLVHGITINELKKLDPKFLLTNSRSS